MSSEKSERKDKMIDQEAYRIHERVCQRVNEGLTIMTSLARFGVLWKHGGNTWFNIQEKAKRYAKENELPLSKCKNNKKEELK